MVNYKDPTDGKFDGYKGEILSTSAAGNKLTARVMRWKVTDGQNQSKTPVNSLNMKLRHVGITAINMQQPQFHYFIDRI